MDEKRKKHLTNVLKLLVSALALAFVYHNIDFGKTWETMRSASVLWLVVALLLYVLSQVMSSRRVRYMLSGVPIEIDRWVNLRLYWLGMFYNFFLPGGVGGDGYKVYWLHKRYPVTVRSVVMALLGDRISGLAAICVYMVGYVSFMQTQVAISYQWLLVLVIPVGLYLYWLLFRLFQKNLCGVALSALWRSHLIQALQMLAAASILVSLGGGGDGLLDEYLFLFLLSSVASAVPITLGGIGAREMTFVLGSELFGTSKDVAVSLSLLFYAVSLVSSLPGLYFALRTDKIDGGHIQSPEVPPSLGDVVDVAAEEHDVLKDI